MNRYLTILISTVVLVALLVFQHQTPIPVVAEPARERLPEDLPGYRVEQEQFCQNEQCGSSFLESEVPITVHTCPRCGSELASATYGELHILPADTQIFKRIYTSTLTGQRYHLSMVIGGRSKASIHRPELCLPGQGFLMGNPHDRTCGGRPFHMLTLQRGNFPPSYFAYTFFNQENKRTANHIQRIFRDVWDRSVHNRIDRWTMVTARAYVADEEAFEKFLTAFSRAMEKGACHE